MLWNSIIFLTIATICAVLGFGDFVGSAGGLAKILFFLFLAFFTGSVIVALRLRWT